MAYIDLDEETGVEHINIGPVTLCGLPRGWTRPNDKPSEKKWGCTCEGCQEELEDLRTIRK